MNASKISFTPAEIHQTPEVLAILMDSILGHYFEKSLASKILSSAQSKGELIVAVADEEVVGFYVNDSHGSFLVFPYLHLLAVKASQRGRSIGSSLLAHLERSTLETPGYPFRPKIFLLVAQENEGAVRFYERHGFERKAVIEDMFGDGDTEFLMMKDLGNKTPDRQ